MPYRGVGIIFGSLTQEATNYEIEFGFSVNDGDGKQVAYTYDQKIRTISRSKQFDRVDDETGSIAGVGIFFGNLY